MIKESTFREVLKIIKEYPDRALDIIDSFSDNQFNSKELLLKRIDHVIDSRFDVVILGCWYGSILFPYLAPRVNRMLAVDLDDFPIRIGKNILFKEFQNIVWCTEDAFAKEWNYANCNLIINTSCEHMRPMKEWPWWTKLRLPKTTFAFQSNNMTNIEGHINCVNSLDEFRNQLPKPDGHIIKKVNIVSEDELIDDRGTRFMIVGEVVTR